MSRKIFHRSSSHILLWLTGGHHTGRCRHSRRWLLLRRLRWSLWPGAGLFRGALTKGRHNADRIRRRLRRLLRLSRRCRQRCACASGDGLVAPGGGKIPEGRLPAAEADPACPAAMPGGTAPGPNGVPGNGGIGPVAGTGLPGGTEPGKPG